MKFKNLNEDVHAEKFAKNERSRILLPIKGFELKNFAEQEGSTKAITAINKHVGYALEGREPILDVWFFFLTLRKKLNEMWNILRMSLNVIQQLDMLKL